MGCARGIVLFENFLSGSNFAGKGRCSAECAFSSLRGKVRGHMSKRAKTDQLTGGSGDVSPQYFTLPANTLSAANTFTEGAIPTPVPRNKVQGDRVTVMEVLKVYFNNPEPDNNPAAGGSVVTATAQLSTSSTAGTSFGNVKVFAFCEKIVRGAFTAAGSYGCEVVDPYVWDCSDAAGHGILVATDNIYFGCNTVGFTATATFTARILYRMKSITLAEYIGIVQSQQ